MKYFLKGYGLIEFLASLPWELIPIRKAYEFWSWTWGSPNALDSYDAVE
jgi:hypothetical protein